MREKKRGLSTSAKYQSLMKFKSGVTYVSPNNNKG